MKPDYIPPFRKASTGNDAGGAGNARTGERNSGAGERNAATGESNAGAGDSNAATGEWNAGAGEVSADSVPLPRAGVGGTARSGDGNIGAGREWRED